MAEQESPFFVGWAAPEGALRPFLLGVGAGLIVLFAVASYLVAATQDDPGDGAFMGRAEAIGVLEARPYPILHVTESERFAPGTTILLSGQGKRGVAEQAAPLDGQLVQVGGLRLARGDLAGLQVGGGRNRLQAVEGADAAERPLPEPLGRWRITGEICDGKCYTGAMRPGRGLAHKACANLCLIGGVPPVFVATDAIEGSPYLLLAGADGGPVGPDILDHVATLVSVEGQVERRGSLLVFRIAPETLRLAGS